MPNSTLNSEPFEMPKNLQSEVREGRPIDAFLLDTIAMYFNAFVGLMIKHVFASFASIVSNAYPTIEPFKIPLPVP